MEPATDRRYSDGAWLSKEAKERQVLVLTRKSQEAIVLTLNGKEILIRCLSCNDGRARIGIDAPSEVRIRREELDERPRRQA